MKNKYFGLIVLLAVTFVFTLSMPVDSAGKTTRKKGVLKPTTAVQAKTIITSVTPKKPTIQAGKQIKVTVKGQNVGGITARVVKGRSPVVSGITIGYDKIKSKTYRGIHLSADSTVTPGSYKLQLRAGNKVIKSLALKVKASKKAKKKKPGLPKTKSALIKSRQKASPGSGKVETEMMQMELTGKQKVTKPDKKGRGGKAKTVIQAKTKVASVNPKKPSLAARAERILPSPKITSFKINNGAENTLVRTVTLNHTATSMPTHYRAILGSFIESADWKPYSTAPTFELSGSIEDLKYITFQVKNGNGSSYIREDAIYYGEKPKIIETFRLIYVNNEALNYQPVHLRDRLTFFIRLAPMQTEPVSIRFFSESPALLSFPNNVMMSPGPGNSTELEAVVISTGNATDNSPVSTALTACPASYGPPSSPYDENCENAMVTIGSQRAQSSAPPSGPSHSSNSSSCGTSYPELASLETPPSALAGANIDLIVKLSCTSQVPIRVTLNSENADLIMPPSELLIVPAGETQITYNVTVGNPPTQTAAVRVTALLSSVPIFNFNAHRKEKTIVVIGR